MDSVALPFCHLAFQAKKPLSGAYPKELRTLGDHLRKRRLDLALTQKDVAQRLVVDPSTLASWEREEHQPTKRLLQRLNETVLGG
jgi:ribosome-binding protein aMBF1 (putative translation factor)